MKHVKVILSEDAEKVYDHLNLAAANSKIEAGILTAVKKKVELIKFNFQYGDPIAKNLIPKDYKEKYGITNLFRVELPNYWRMLYSLKANGEIEIVAFILDLIDHEEYNKKFNYGKK